MRKKGIIKDTMYCLRLPPYTQAFHTHTFPFNRTKDEDKINTLDTASFYSGNIAYNLPQIDIKTAKTRVPKLSNMHSF